MAEALKIALGAQPRARDDYNYNSSVSISDVAIAMKLALDAGLGAADARPAKPARRLGALGAHAGDGLKAERRRPRNFLE